MKASASQCACYLQLKFTARLVKLGSGPVPFKKLFAELSTATFNATPVPQPVVIAPKIKFNVVSDCVILLSVCVNRTLDVVFTSQPGSPPVPIASPDLTQALASPSASAGGLLSPKADTGSPLSKYRSAMPTLDELNSLVAPPLVGTSHTGAGNNGSNRSFFRFDTSPPAAGGAKGSPVEALKSGLKESHSLSGAPCVRVRMSAS